MKIINTKFKDLKIIKHNSFKDKRGYLRITHNQKIINKKFTFEYCTTSKKNSLRGFHFQYKFQQAKYVTVLKGKILDCVIDLRSKSKTFGRIFSILLKQNLHYFDKLILLVGNFVVFFLTLFYFLQLQPL